MADPGRDSLRAELLGMLAQPLGEPLPEARFNELALASFAWQYARNQPFAAFCRRRGRSPDQVNHWSEVPAVPTAAFKFVPLVAGDPAAAQAVFRTSGTTMGAKRRGVNHVLDLRLYHGSLLPTFAAFLLPDGARPLMLSLMPPTAELPDSSLAHMTSTVIEHFGAPASGSFASVARGLDAAALAAALHQAAGRGQPVCLLGTSLAFLHWLEELERQGARFQLPPGSRLMDTGGYKGRERSVPVGEMLARYQEYLGIQPAWCVNEYGMTELASQLYDGQLRAWCEDGRESGRRKRGAPWLRTRAVDPETLAPLPPGQTGLLQHFDLANLDSVLAVQTEDLGAVHAEGVELLGRVGSAPPRGCSIAMDELLTATRERWRGGAP